MSDKVKKSIMVQGSILAIAGIITKIIAYLIFLVSKNKYIVDMSIIVVIANPKNGLFK